MRFQRKPDLLSRLQRQEATADKDTDENEDEDEAGLHPFTAGPPAFSNPELELLTPKCSEPRSIKPVLNLIPSP